MSCASTFGSVTGRSHVAVPDKWLADTTHSPSARNWTGSPFSPSPAPRSLPLHSGDRSDSWGQGSIRCVQLRSRIGGICRRKWALCPPSAIGGSTTAFRPFFNSFVSCGSTRLFRVRQHVYTPFALVALTQTRCAIPRCRVRRMCWKIGQVFYFVTRAAKLLGPGTASGLKNAKTLMDSTVVCGTLKNNQVIWGVVRPIQIHMMHARALR
jgi:hypothetical protein